MATLIPDVEKQRVVFPSSAEEAFYRVAGKSLSAGWRIYYSCVLSAFESGEGLQEGEIDFVLWHPSAGFVVVEVKGGRIQIENGDFFSINRQGERFRIQNPFNQALVWKNRFYRFLKRENMRMPVCHAVCLPYLDESDLPMTAGVERDLVIGRQRLDCLEETLFEIVRKSHLEKYLKFTSPGEKTIDRLLKGSHFESRRFLREYVDHHDLRVADIESIQESLVTPVTSARRLGIEGEAGTGKTMLAAMLARRYRDEGAKVLLTSSNPVLNERLRVDIGRGVDVMTYGELGSQFGVELLRVPAGYQGKLEDWLQFDGPEKLKAAIGADSRRYDVILCDEAQDVQPFWWEAIERLLISPESGRFYLFFDRSQGVFGSGGGDTLFVPEQVLPVAPPYFPLVHNYRTTKEISTFAREFRTGSQVLKSHSGRSGFMPQIVTYKDRADAQKKLELLLSDLIRREHLRPDEIALISARNPKAPESILTGMNAPSIGLNIDAAAKAAGGTGPHIATVAGFKGLEAKVAVLINFSEHKMEISNPIMSSMMYVAATRARHLVVIMLREDDAKVAVVNAAIKAAAVPGSTGPLVIERPEDITESEGVVTFFDPDRMGSLTIDDGARGRRSFLFFPHDLGRAGLENIRVGMRLLFRPRQIGDVVVASDFRVPRAS